MLQMFCFLNTHFRNEIVRNESAVQEKKGNLHLKHLINGIYFFLLQNFILLIAFFIIVERALQVVDSLMY